MTRISETWRSAAVLGVAATALAACGGGGSSGGAAAQSSSAAASGGASAAGGTASGGAASGAAGTASASVAPVPVQTKDGQLVIGTLLPQTGNLAFLGPPMIAGAELAIRDVNAAGGVLGKPVKKFDGDSGDQANAIAPGTVDRLFGQKVDAIIGAASSGVTLSVIDKITGSGILEISPANTSDALTDYDDKGLYFRTAPPDLFQGRVIADQASEDGNETLGILALQDAYGEGLAKQAKSVFEGNGGKVVPDPVIYDPKAASFTAEVSKIKAENPDAIAIIGFEETKKIIPELIAQGLGADKKKLYFVDGNLSDYSKDFPPGTLKGAKGTNPGVFASDEFKKKLATVAKLKDFNYAAESYDATVLLALAAEAAKSDAPKDIADKLAEVSQGGTKCKDFKSCVALVKDGKDVDYDGLSGPISFDDKGNPAEATMGVYQYDQDNKPQPLEAVKGKVNE